MGLVTGASAGICAATARATARGCPSRPAAHRGVRIKEAAAELSGAIAVHCAVTGRDQVARAVRLCLGVHDRIDVLVNHAGRRVLALDGPRTVRQERRHQRLARTAFRSCGWGSPAPSRSLSPWPAGALGRVLHGLVRHEHHLWPWDGSTTPPTCHPSDDKYVVIYTMAARGRSL
ncbi:SDR family NAD(P)-dependent oxidoreductase [Streptomyces sp. NBC_00414]|uniref:SDR family NAD(P)-dependent oxidoreductase n=1 Tax=Streptomyces sp. NBC_00414 TaxID=2975739 RepID=UPI002E1B5A62